MTWVRFLRDFDFKPTPQSTVEFRTGDEKNVTRACAEKALAAGAVAKMKAPDGKKPHNRQPA